MSLETAVQERSIQDSVLFSNHLGSFTATAWLPSHDLEYEQWAEAIQSFSELQGRLPFYIGDGIGFGRNRYGEMYTQAIKEFGLTYATLTNYKWVAGSVPPEIRRADLTWEHHRVIAHLPSELQIHWLDMAEEAGWSSRLLRSALSGQDVNTINLGDVKVISRPKRTLMTEFMSLALVGDETIDGWVDSLGREEINRLLDGETEQGLRRLLSILELLSLY